MNDRKTSKPVTPSTRLPYERPAVLTEEVFETLALSCGKGNPMVCPSGGAKS